MSIKWTNKNIRLLIGYNELGFSREEIGNILNTTKSAINAKCYKLKIKSCWKDTIYICDNCKKPYNPGSKICIFCGYNKYNSNSLAISKPEWLKEWDYERNIISPSNITKSSHIQVWWRDKLDHRWMSSPHNKIKNDSSCPYCSNKRILVGFNDLETKYPEIAKEWDYTKNSDTPLQILYGSMKYRWWICKKCNNNWKCRVDSRTKLNTGCPKCNISNGENIINLLLNKYNVNYYTEFRIPQCRSKLPLPFDFYLPDYNTLIEYQGIQHYPKKYQKLQLFNQTSRHSYEDLLKIQQRDKIKYNFCNTNNIKLIIIPYWEQKNIEQILIRELNLQ